MRIDLLPIYVKKQMHHQCNNDLKETNQNKMPSFSVHVPKI